MMIHHKLRLYYLTTIFSFIIAVAGFGYNTWRLEVSEANNTIRTASFEVLKLLAETEQGLYLLHYDQNPVEGSPRIIWVQMGLIKDLSPLINNEAQRESEILYVLWSDDWQRAKTDNQVTTALVAQIDSVRDVIKQTLVTLN